MTIGHLAHDELGIRCKMCGDRWEASLRDPEVLLMQKERIAKKHTCRTDRNIPDVRVIVAPTGNALQRYWSVEMKRLQAQMATV